MGALLHRHVGGQVDSGVAHVEGVGRSERGSSGADLVEDGSAREEWEKEMEREVPNEVEGEAEADFGEKGIPDEVSLCCCCCC